MREAILQLEAHGLVVHMPYLGTTIRTLDNAEVSELYETRVVLESTAARLVEPSLGTAHHWGSDLAFFGAAGNSYERSLPLFCQRHNLGCSPFGCDPFVNRFDVVS